MSECLSQLADDVTAGLRDDPELRLDVRAEVLSHLEDTAEVRGDDAAALAAFGAPQEVASALVQANLRRMKLRALARLGVRAVLVPAAVLVAILIGYGGLVRVLDLWQQLRELDMKPSTQAAVTASLPRLPYTITLDQRVTRLNRIRGSARYPDASFWRVDYLGRWQAARGTAREKLYFAQYACHYGVPRQTTELPAYVTLMREGMRLDPDNALYHYQLAGAYFGLALEEHGPPYLRAPVNYTLRDHRLLEQGMAELRVALAKPYLDTYHQEVLRQDLAQLPPPRASEDHLDRMMLVATEVFPEYAGYRGLAHRIPYCARVLLAEGRVAEAQPCLLARTRLPRQICEHSDFSIDAMAASGISKTIGEGLTETYLALGQPAQAQAMRAATARATAPMEALQRHRRESAQYFETTLRQHAGIVASRFLPIAGMPTISPRALAPTRNAEQAVIEQLVVNSLLLMLVLLMAYSAVVALAYRLRARAVAQRPLLLLPSWRMLATVVCFGILLPLVIYLVYTRWLGGRDTSSLVMPRNDTILLKPRVLLEFLFISAVLLVGPVTLAVRAIRRRCRSLGIAAPRGYGLVYLVVLLVAATVGMLALDGGVLVLLQLTLGDWLATVGTPGDAIIVVTTLATLLVLGVLAVYLLGKQLAPRLAPRQPEVDYTLYRGTVARSLVPIYALTILLLAALCRPSLAYEEATWLKRDHLLLVREQSPTFWPADKTMATMLRTELLKALE